MSACRFQSCVMSPAVTSTISLKCLRKSTPMMWKSTAARRNHQE